MKLKSVLILFCFTLLPIGCGLHFGQSGDMDESLARDLIRRNIFLEDDRFPISDPKVYQYGNIHVDGPNGGMLYRFRSTPEALVWIVEQHNMQQVAINEGDQLPLQFLDNVPEWWKPNKINSTVYYIFQEEFSTGGKRQFIVLFNVPTNEIYAVEHFSDMPGG